MTLYGYNIPNRAGARSFILFFTVLLLIRNNITDVVRAYKGVLKEKEALESTVQALSAATSVRDEASDGVTEDQTRSGSECPTDNETDSDAVRGDLGDGRDASDSGAEGKHGDRLATLTKDHLSPSGNIKLPVCTQRELS